MNPAAYARSIGEAHGRQCFETALKLHEMLIERAALIEALESALFWASENKQRAGTLDVAKMRAALAKAKE